MDLWKKVNISHFSEKAFLNGHKHVNYMHVHVIIREKNEMLKMLFIPRLVAVDYDFKSTGFVNLLPLHHKIASKQQWIKWHATVRKIDVGELTN